MFCLTYGKPTMIMLHMLFVAYHRSRNHLLAVSLVIQLTIPVYKTTQWQLNRENRHAQLAKIYKLLNMPTVLHWAAEQQQGPPLIEKNES